MPGEGSASRRSSLEQGLPPILVGEIPLHRAPQALLHVHLRRPVQLRLDLAGINRVAPVVARPMPRRWMRFFIAELQSRSEAYQLLAKLITEECHRALKALSQRDVCPPTQGGQPAHIQLFLRRAIRFAGIPMDLALEAGGLSLSHRLRQITDREIHAGAHIEKLLIVRPGLPVVQGKHAGLAQIIHMQELPQGGAGAPAGHAGVAALNRFVEAADQGRQHVAVGGVVVVARAIQIGGQLLRRRLRLQADGIKAVLPAQRLIQLDADDLGDCIPLVGRLQGPGEQRFLADRLLGELRVDAAAA